MIKLLKIGDLVVEKDYFQVGISNTIPTFSDLPTAFSNWETSEPTITAIDLIKLNYTAWLSGRLTAESTTSLTPIATYAKVRENENEHFQIYTNMAEKPIGLGDDCLYYYSIVTDIGTFTSDVFFC